MDQDDDGHRNRTHRPRNGDPAQRALAHADSRPHLRRHGIRTLRMALSTSRCRLSMIITRSVSGRSAREQSEGLSTSVDLIL